MLRFDKFTVKAQEALQSAQEMAGRSGQQLIEPLHLLWALIARAKAWFLLLLTNWARRLQA